MSSNKQQGIVTFKAEGALLEALRAIPNRSAFIRLAVLAALENVCPLCQGTGILTLEQKEHWAKFAQHHAVQECSDCHEWHLVCHREESERLEVKNEELRMES